MPARHLRAMQQDQGIIKPVSHRSLQCSFHKVQNNVKYLSQKTAMQCLNVLECACRHVLGEESVGMNLEEKSHVFPIEILLLLPVSNAKVKRGFSSMRRIKTDRRSRLGERTLDNLMRISVDGPAVSDFSSDVAVKCFFAQPP